MKPKPIEEVTNTWEQLIRWKKAGLNTRPVAIGPAHSPSSRGPGLRNGWFVWSPWELTDPSGPWYYYNKMHFADCQYFGGDITRSEARKAALDAAKKWADEKYGPFNWVRNRMGEYVPKELNDLFPIRRDK